MVPAISSLVFALSLTLLVETLIYYFLKPRDLKFALSVIIMNGVLNVTMNIGFFLYFFAMPVHNYLRTLFIIEALIVIVETLIIYKINKTPLFKTFLFSLLANGVSLGLGLLNDTYTIIDSRRAYSLIFSVINIGLLCVFLYYFTTFPPLDEVDGKRNRHGNHEEKRKAAHDEKDD